VGKIVWISGFPAHYMRDLHVKLESIYSDRLCFFYLDQDSRVSGERGYEQGELPSSVQLYPGSNSFRCVSLIKHVYNKSPDIVILSSHYPWPIFFTGIFFLLIGKKVCYWSDTNIHDIWLSSNVSQLFRKVVMFPFLKSMAALMYMGKANRDYYISTIGRRLFHQKRFFVPYPHNHDKYAAFINSVNLSENNSEKFRLISVSRLIKAKSIGNMIHAISMLSADIQDRLEYVVIGDGSERQSIERDIKKYNLENVVSLLGAVNSEDVPVHIMKSNMLILPSIYEPWGLVVNEAMSLGVPVIAPYWVGSAQDLVIHGYTGVLIEDNSALSLSSIIKHYTNNIDEVKTLAENCVKHITMQKLYLSQSIKGIEEMITKLDDGKAIGG